MASRKAKQIALNECSITLGAEMDWEAPLNPKQRSSGKDAIDIRELVAEINYYESIDAPFLRCDITVVDAIDLYKSLRGKEVVKVKLTSESSNDEPLEVIFRLFKVGSFVKNERAVVYILHCVSHEQFLNEARRIFGAFGPCEKHKNKEHFPKYVAKDILKGGSKVKSENFEAHSQICFYSPNWRPIDAIVYCSDKVVRKGGSAGGKVSEAQSGFLFYENKDGFHFKSIDALCSQGVSGRKFTYSQQSVETNDPIDEFYKIQSATYPDKTNHLEKLRSGLYKTSVLGISVAAQGQSFLPSGGSGSGNSTANVKIKNMEPTFENTFKKANTIDTEPPFPGTKFTNPDTQPATRYKFRVMPSLNHMPKGGGNANGGTTEHIDTIQVASYASARYALLNSIQLTIVVPGNTMLTIGQIIEVSIPESKSEDGQVVEDRVYSGKYLIASLHHAFRKQGMITTLYLTKDSIRKAK